MDVKMWSVLLVFLVPAVTALWMSSQEERRSGLRRTPHYHTKRHMLSSSAGDESRVKRRHTSQKPRELRKKPSGHLKPLDEDDMENDEVVSVAVGPPPIRPKYEKANWRGSTKPIHNTTTNVTTATNLIKDVLTQLGREFLTHQVSEDFVFGQYLGNAMKNLTSELRLKMQHEILELIVKYQRINKGEMRLEDRIDKMPALLLKDIKIDKPEKRGAFNDTEENWPDFSNLAKIVG